MVREPRFYSAVTIQREPKPSATSVQFVVLSVPAKFVFIRVHSWLNQTRTIVADTSKLLHANSAAVGTSLLSSFDALLGRCGEKKNDTHISNWSAVRSDYHDCGHVWIRNSGQQLSLANGDLESRWRSLYHGYEKRSYGLEVVD